MRRSYKLEELGCAACAARMEEDIAKLDGVNSARVNFMTSKLVLDADTDDIDALLDEAQAVCAKYETDCTIVR